MKLCPCFVSGVRESGFYSSVQAGDCKTYLRRAKRVEKEKVFITLETRFKSEATTSRTGFLYWTSISCKLTTDQAFAHSVTGEQEGSPLSSFLLGPVSLDIGPESVHAAGLNWVVISTDKLSSFELEAPL